MTYTPTDWSDSTKFSTTNLGNAEKQYDEGYTYFLAHVHDTGGGGVHDWYYTNSEMEDTFWYADNDGAGSTCDADLIYTSAGGNLDYDDLAAASAPSGTIILFHGVSIPSGWVECEGTGTPHITDKWVIGAGGTYAPGATGGSTTCISTDTINVASYALQIADMPSHRHVFEDRHNNDRTGSDVYGGCRFSPQTSSSGNTASYGSDTAHTHTGSVTTTATENLPPTMAVYYIMKT